MQLPLWILFVHSSRGHDRCRNNSAYPKRYSYLQKRLKHANIWMKSMGYGSQTISFSAEENQDYIEECQAIANPITYRSYPSRPNLSPFAKRPKAAPLKRSNMVTRCNIEKLSKPRKINVEYHPAFLE